MSQEHYTVEKLCGGGHEDIWSACEKLAATMTPPSYFCSGEWLQAVASMAAALEDIHLFVVRKGGDISAVLPLETRRNMLGGNDLHFLGSAYFPDPLGVITGQDSDDQIWLALKNALRAEVNWDRVVLEFMLDDECDHWGEQGEKVSVQPYITLPASIDELLGEFGKKKRYKIRAAVRRAKEQGCEFVKSTSQEDRIAILQDLYTLHAKRANEKNLESTFKGHELFEFHRRLVMNSESAHLYSLRRNGQTIAALYGFIFHDTFLDYQIAHDPDYASLSPGSVLLYNVIEACCKDGLDEFNFLQGDEEYKNHWTKESRNLHNVVLYGGNWRGYVLRAITAVKSQVKRVIRRVFKN